MRFLHVSDTHVGFSAYGKVTPQGLNQREQDFFDAFRRAVDLALAERVDAVLHSGDIFDSVRPTNRAVTFVMEEVRRLGDAGVPFVAIAGNHETPKMRETGSVLRFLEFLPNTFPVYKGAYEKVRIGDVAFHCVPHAASNEALVAELDRVEKDADARWDVLTFHAGVMGIADFRSGEFNEHVVPTSYLRSDMDHIALGHYHKPTQLARNAWYAGSTERCTFREEGEPKGAYVVDLEGGSVRFHDLGPRPMVTLPPVDCRDVAELEVPTLIYKRLADAVLDGRIARLRVDALPPHVYAALDFPRIRKLTEAALHFQAVYEVAHESLAAGASEDGIGGLAAEFDGYFARVPLEGMDRERLGRKAVDLLEAAQAGGKAA